ncbi:hypothetical protein NC653_038011 [Populus alba x Populus x berolinensis]|uniref:GDSL esterase/lipase n=1 Tax=Populus alba x Populus x berolinensis TaxID=444605 RepID=A0AAD6LH61_9ROSI|nr:hypothetical protein NC653_038011 [Populus alba x Populus x berolinensis]
MNSINWASYISFLLCHFLLVNDSHGASDHLGPFKSDVSIPALFVFGDSWVDNGNGRYMGNPNPSSAYSVDFKVDNQSRASNGKTMADFIAQTFGLPFLPPFLSLKKSESIQFGANYASSGCGILPETKKYTYVSILSPYLELYHLMVKFRTCTYIYTQGKLMESV